MVDPEAFSGGLTPLRVGGVGIPNIGHAPKANLFLSLNINADSHATESSTNDITPLHQSINCITHPNSEKLSSLSSWDLSFCPSIWIGTEMFIERVIEMSFHKTSDLLINR